jgi:O-antigen/teichoic acid export membrane protein
MEKTAKKSESSKKSLSKGAIWIGSSRLLVNAIGLISTLLLARLLVPQDFGLVAVAESVFALVGAVTELMLATSLIQHRRPRAYHYHTAWTLNLSRAVLLAVFMAALGYPFAAIYGDDRFIELFIVLAGATLIGGLENPMLVTLSRKLIFWQEFALNVSSKVVGFVVAIVIAYVFRSYWALVIGALAAQAARVLISYAVISYRPRFSLRGYRDLLSFSFWLTLSHGIQTANGRLDPLLLGLFVPSAMVGQFAVGNKLAYLPVREGLGPLRSLFFPVFSRMQDDIHRLRYAYLKGQGLVSLIAMPLGLGFALVAAPLVELALGENWLPAVPVIQIFAAISALQASETVQPLAMALDRTRTVFRRDLQVLLIRIPLVLAGLALGAVTPLGSLMGIVIGSAAASLVLLAFSLRLVTVLSGISLATQLSVTIRPFFAAVVMSAGILILQNNAGLFNRVGGPLVEIAVTIATGAVLYIAALALLWLGSGRPDGAESALLALSHRSWVIIRQRARLGHS